MQLYVLYVGLGAALTGILFLYGAMVRYFYAGWKNRPRFTCSKQEKTRSGFTVIIPFRNESQHLAQLIETLQKQIFQPDLLEIILVNDHSTDSWQNVIPLKNAPPLRVIQSTGEGKKCAIEEGVRQSKHDWIVTLDADCRPQPEWLSSVADAIVRGQPHMLIGGVKMNSNGTFLENFQQMDFLSLQISGAGAALNGHPIMCNGANLCFRKEAYLSLNLERSRHIYSGDDMFLMHEMKRMNFNIQYLHEPSTIVQTWPENTFQKLLRQRIRWTGKSIRYKDRDTILTALIVLAMNLIWITTLCGIFYSLSSAVLFISICFLKGWMDRPLLKAGVTHFGIQWKEGFYWLMQLLHPLFTLLIVFMSLIFRSTWKNRKL